jgi:6,7-dimethyl-8-ribityllumazine synthase
MVHEFLGSQEVEGRRFAIVASSFNEFIVRPLVEGAQRTFDALGLPAEDLDLAWCPGAVELPLVAKKLADSGRYDGIVALGCVLRGGTPHFDYVCSIVADGIARASLDSGLPIAFGVLTVDTMEQAIERSGPNTGNKGSEAAEAAVEMVSLLASIDAPGQG